MIPHNFADVLREKVDAEIAEESKQIAIGMAADWGDYKERVGGIKGLGKLKRIIDELTEDSK